MAGWTLGPHRAHEGGGYGRSGPMSDIGRRIPKIPGNMVFVIETDGKTTRYTSDQLSPELIGTLLKAK
jgi:hypothetical protein